MNFSHDELLHELARTEATMDIAVRRAGEGADPELERQLDAHARALRVMLGADGADVVADAVDAAKRVLHSAEPAAPLLMLQMARDNLSSIVRRSQRLGQAA